MNIAKNILNRYWNLPKVDKVSSRNLKYPRDEEEHFVLMQAWKIHKARYTEAHRIASGMLKKYPADTRIYSRTLTYLLRNIMYPAEFEI